jgi:glycosyltransferase involved in cell wall biosynthesis
MKIAWLAPYPVTSLTPAFKPERLTGSHPCSWIVNLSAELARMSDVELHMITTSQGIRATQSFQHGNIHFHVVRHAIPGTLRGFPEWAPVDALLRYSSLRARIASMVDSIHPDVVHVHGTEAGFGLAGLDTNYPCLVSIQGLVSIYKHVESSLFFTMQTPLEVDVVRRGKYFANRTSWGYDFVRRINPEAIQYEMQEAVSPEFFSDREGTSEPNLLIVGGIQKRKGVDVAIRALPKILAKYSSARLHIIGGGTSAYVEELSQLAGSLGVSGAMSFLGSKSLREIAALHGKSLILLHPTLMDNSPNSVAEAMVSGLPVIASRVGGLPSMIENGHSGVLVAVGDHVDLAEQTIALIADRDRRELLAQHAREIARTRHNPHNVAIAAIGVYRDILARESILGRA